MQVSNSVIISLHPQHAHKILSGEKKLEFRRTWAKKSVSAVVIYTTAPVKQIVAIAYVKKIHMGSPTYLWQLAQKLGGGISRRELYKYFNGKRQAYAVEFESVRIITPPVAPNTLIDNFRAPQSFAYLTPSTLSQLEELPFEKLGKKGKIIFIAGVHGVGKSSMCEEFSQRFGVMHKSASQLIREANAEAVTAGSKVVKNIQGNQELLIQAISKIRESGITLLLDGHFSLINLDNIPTALPTNVFSDLGIDAVTVIHDDAISIASRINHRDEKSISVDQVATHQSLEISRAIEVSEELDLPYESIKAFDQAAFNLHLSGILNEQIA